MFLGFNGHSIIYPSIKTDTRYITLRYMTACLQWVTCLPSDADHPPSPRPGL